MPFNLASTRMTFIPMLVVGGLTVASLAVLTSAWGRCLLLARRGLTSFQGDSLLLGVKRTQC
jgi:hypothetical protein